MKNILISGSDPGGFQTVLALVQPLREKKHNVMLIVGGAAIKMCADKNLECIDGDKLLSEGVRSLEDKITEFNPHVFLSGTSGSSQSVDKKILAITKKLGVPSIYVLDFWSNYWQRFSSEGVKDFAFLPDFVCVIDQYCKNEMIKEGFSPDIIKVTGNPHFDHFADTITKNDEHPNSVLFVSQPVRELNEKDGFAKFPFDEFVAVGDLLDAVVPLEGVSLSVRLHPRENPAKFDELIAKHSGRISISKEPSLEAALSKASCIVGMFSPVLLQATLAGKSTISYQPGGALTDPLITNKLGITKLVDSKDVLVEKMSSLHAEGFQQKGEDLSSWPKDSTKKVLTAIDAVLAGKKAE